MDLLRLYYTTNLGTMVDEGVFDAYTTSVPSACFHWFAQPVEPEELRNYVNKK